MADSDYHETGEHHMEETSKGSHPKDHLNHARRDLDSYLTISTLVWLQPDTSPFTRSQGSQLVDMVNNYYPRIARVGTTAVILAHV